VFGGPNQPQEQHRRDERLKLIFDYRKHLATLTIGTAVVFVAINQVLRLQPPFVVAPLLLFAISALLTLFSMVGVIAEIGSALTQESSRSSDRRWAWWQVLDWPVMLGLATALYMGGYS
jgi:hypothetical protein